MRKIERDMIAAIKSGKDWRCDNTSVTHDPVVGGVEIEVRLHGNLIAKRYMDDMHAETYHWEYTLAGWNTPTTRSRISALMREFERSRCCGVGTKQGQAELRFMLEDSIPVSSSGWFTAMGDR